MLEAMLLEKYSEKINFRKYLIGGCFQDLIKSNIQVNWIITCLSIAFASIAGDLIISKLKRINNKKDSGIFLPGNGGFLDRLDSLFLATFVYYFIICM